MPAPAQNRFFREQYLIAYKYTTSNYNFQTGDPPKA